MKQVTKTTVRALAALLGMAAGAAQAFCGFYAGKADARLFNEASQVVMVRDGPRTVLTMVNDYKGALSEFAMVVPTPQVIREGQVRVVEKAVVEALDAFTAPRLAEYHDADPCRFGFDWGIPVPPQPQVVYSPMAAMALPSPAKSDRAAELGVTVDAKFTLEEYDIVSLSAQQSDGLEAWLRENGYRIPAGASAALKPYIAQGMKFFVAKVNLEAQALKQTGNVRLRPLQFAFESPKFMLPMRLGMVNAPPGKPQDMIVYLLTREGRVESSSYRTAPIPANMDLPYFVKPEFQRFYKTMFEEQARREAHKVVFTEYFWDMGWCDPCAADPLSLEQLRKLGAFWVGGGDAQQNFAALMKPGAEAGRIDAQAARQRSGGAAPVLVTRLHLRYTPESFPEDLMLTQTRDRQNSQARYVIKQPYKGTAAQCSDRMAQADCRAECEPRVERAMREIGMLRQHAGALPAPPADDRPTSLSSWRRELMQQCAAACGRAKLETQARAARYYERELPERIAAERQTLAQLTGWTAADIDALPDAARYSTPAAGAPKRWWERFLQAR